MNSNSTLCPPEGPRHVPYGTSTCAWSPTPNQNNAAIAECCKVRAFGAGNNYSYANLIANYTQKISDFAGPECPFQFCHFGHSDKEFKEFNITALDECIKKAVNGSGYVCEKATRATSNGMRSGGSVTLGWKTMGVVGLLGATWVVAGF